MAWSSFAEIEKAALELTSLKVPARAQKVVFQQFEAGHGYEKSAGTGTLSEDTADFGVAPVPFHLNEVAPVPRPAAPKAGSRPTRRRSERWPKKSPPADSR